MRTSPDWISGALDALDNVARSVEELRRRIDRLAQAQRMIARELPQTSENRDLRLLARHAIAASEMRAVEFWAALPDADMKNEPAPREEIEEAAARLVDLLEQRRLEAQRWRGLAERLRDTVDDETWRGLLEEHGLDDGDAGEADARAQLDELSRIIEHG